MDVKLIYLLYRALQIAGLPFIVLYFAIRAIRDRRYLRCFGQRLGFLPHQYKQNINEAIWLHAVSVGEALSSVGLLRRMRSAFPATPIFVSSTTLAGKAIAEERLRPLADGVFYAPVDYCSAVRRVLRTIRPAVVVIAETEIWPNLYREIKRVGCGLIIVNGRMSDRAAPGYARFRWFFRRVLALPDKILVQSETSRRRYLAAGAPPGRISLGGNLKYDFEPRETEVADSIRDFLERLRPREVWIAASTMPPAHPADVDEDDVVIATFQQLAPEHPGLLMMLVPRKPERFEEVAFKLEQSGVAFLRRSRLSDEEPALSLPAVLLVDSIGELSGLFSLADVVFMGGTLAERGGHNILEPAFFGLPIITGPHMENFREISEEFLGAEACLSIADSLALAPTIDRLLKEAQLRTALGQRAQRLAQGRRGAADRALREVEILYSWTMPRFRPALPLFQAFWLLSRLWWLGGLLKRKIDSSRCKRLATPVISVGSVNMGGAGKTPFVLRLAECLKAAGHRPAILTRGYRRRAPEKRSVFEAGESVPVVRTGDEAQILLRSGVGPVGIDANRADAGRVIEQSLHPGVFILDDGFQHWRLARVLDIVLVDSLNPFGGSELFPLGRLREPLDALGRADLFVIARAERERSYEGIREQLRAHNAGAPIFVSRVVPEFWVEYGAEKRWRSSELPFRRIAAFCSLANPAAFWHTLRSLGYHAIARWTFQDHHRYKPLELRRMAAHARNVGAEALLTTEKDLMNLSPNAAECLSPLSLYWLRIGIEIDEEDRLLNYIETRISSPAGLQRQ